MAKNMEITLLYDFYGEMLTEKQQDVIELYYNNDLSLAEIAENEGISRQGVRDSIKRAESQMLDMEERLGLAKRFREMKVELEEIIKDAREIQSLNDGLTLSREIGDKALHIEQVAKMLTE